MSDLNDFIVQAYTKTCAKHRAEYNVLIGCIECLTDIMRRINGR
jgi:hypothetical protein